ncbi:Oxidoreductase-like protein [Hirsutella rhossiliensis]|uniref:Oxidoreductase-like protein n=1 Tax=Hirsutella rhossiliensis TaxID=111463 RepID=A0A9P8MW58_9HYPO|nr:Oxidoreductase-like protein [Hirsutella rhossiliensis]KAH0961499.1 Oxidoreductase-like protein [Hirsutella rhossiliensis]
MSASKRLLPSRLSLLRSASSSPSRNFTSTTRLAVQGEPWPQRSPLGAYYESIIRDPTPYPFKEKPEDPPDSADPDVQPPGKKPESPSAPPPTKKKPGPAEKARIVFGSRLLGPAEQADRLAAKKAQSTYIAGVLVPPRPEEPDNCCMSGCVNCVWDRFRDDMEEWSARKNEAQMRLNDKEASIDADGGGSQGGWGVRLGNAKIAKDLWDEEVFENVPVGIREFMKQEKRLKEKHQREGTMGG